MSYIGRAPSYGLFEKQSFVGNSVTTSFALNYPVSSPGGLLVSKNGTILEPNVGYAVNYQTITFLVAPIISDVLYVVYLGRLTLTPYAVGKQIVKDTFTGDGTTVIFTTSTPVIINAALLVFVDGVQQSITTNYTVLGNQITFTSAPLLSAVIDVINLGTESASVATVTDGTVTFAKMNSVVAGSVGQWTIITTGTTAAVNGYWYMADTSGGGITLTLPASPTLGMTFRFMDVASSFSTNNLTLGRNGNKIMGLSSDMIVSTTNAANAVVWSNSTNGWRLLHV